jgi:hypothetical protein
MGLRAEAVPPAELLRLVWTCETFRLKPEELQMKRFAALLALTAMLSLGAFAQTKTAEQAKAKSNDTGVGHQGFDTKVQDKGSVKASTETKHVDIQKLNNDQHARDKDNAKKAHLDDHSKIEAADKKK